ncbi:Ig-like domain-containing protein, partial [Streptomyces sp. NPDC005407]|uniref:Ig-like domain-containing protein n=1 Tax=Streptomyces sp. NPDC005407 TaxID=3155340 RepID=UPI0033BBA103
TVTVGDGPLGVAIGTIDAERIPTKLTLKAKKQKKDKDHPEGGDGLTLTAKLTAEGQPLEGKDITFSNAIPLCTDTTDGKGKATCKVPGKQDKDTCYTATFPGDDTYLPSTATLCKKHDNGKPDLSPVLPGQSDVRIPVLSPGMG